MQDKMMGYISSSPYSSMPTAATMAHPSLVTFSAKPIFSSPALSLALEPRMEGMGDMGILMGESFDSGLMARLKEDEFESRSGSDNLDGASGDEQEAIGDKSSRKKKYHRHTPYQIQELEASFKENPHPDEKARLELGKKLGLVSKQVKFWFQNRRTQMKNQLERHENIILKHENDKLRIENIAMKEAMTSPVCRSCGGLAVLGDISIDEHQLRIENARLKDELNRICVLANEFLGRPLASFGNQMPPALPISGVELSVGRNGFASLSSMENNVVPIGLDLGNGISNALPSMPQTRTAIGMAGFGIKFDKSTFLELALAAMNELVKLAEVDNPLWLRSSDAIGESLNLEEYLRIFPPCIGMRPGGFVTEATRATGMVIINSAALVETLLDINQWKEMFPSMIGRTSVVDVISSGMGGTRNGALQLMHAEFQVLSPLVPVRQVKFLRFCKQHADGMWAVVDVSVDCIQEGSNVQKFMNCRRLPSGCIVQDMPNGYAKVIWVEHSEYDESLIHYLYRPLLRSGIAFGARKWVATLQKQCEYLALFMSSSVLGENHAVTPGGKRSMVNLAQCMTHNFCAAVCATVHKWEVIQVGNLGMDTRLMMRKSVNNPGEPPGIVLSATTSVWMPVSQQSLFSFLQNEQLRSQWDVLFHVGPMESMFSIAKGRVHADSISLLRASPTAGNANESSMLILQETSMDASGSLVVYAPIDSRSMTMVMNGGDSSCVSLLPSGFAILPEYNLESVGPNNCNGSLTKEGRGAGSLLTVVFQILVNCLPAGKLTMESVDTVNALLSRTLQNIKAALNCN